jgi:energy-coupling factor transporter ATP-binding protein EcfA2
MAKSNLSFVCQNCGAAYNRWQGKCESCGEWNTLAEEDTTGSTSMPVSIRSKRKGRLFALETLTGKSVEAPRLPSGMAELDRVTGGGFVRGSVLLVGGDPGIGKSTLLTQATSLLARAGHRAVYISGEEAVAQVRLRAERLGLAGAQVELAAETSIENRVVATSTKPKVPSVPNSVDGVAVKPALALGGWVGFEPSTDGAMLMGDLVLTEDEVSPVMAKLMQSGIEITALHNHLIRATPATLYLHVRGHGDPVRRGPLDLAAAALQRGAGELLHAPPGLAAGSPDGVPRDRGSRGGRRLPIGSGGAGDALTKDRWSRATARSDERSQVVNVAFICSRVNGLAR